MSDQVHSASLALRSPVGLRLQFPGLSQRRTQSQLSMWRFLEMEQKLYREISAKKISAKAQQIAVELAPAADCGMVRVGKSSHVLTGTCRVQARHAWLF